MALGKLQPAHLSQGNLAEVPLVEILGYAYAHRKTGHLSLSEGRHRKEIYFFQGFPTFVTSTAPAENLLEVLIQFRKLAPDDIAQIQLLQSERGYDAEQALTMLGLLSAAELQSFQVETLSQMVISACGWNQGRYQFQEGVLQISDRPIFDLSPLELIYQGVKQNHALNLAIELSEIQTQKVRLVHGWEEMLALPEVYYEHSDILDLFEQEITVGESIPRLYADLGDLHESLLLLYLLLVTGLLELLPPPARPAPGKPAPLRTGPASPSDRFADTVYLSTQRKREELEAPPKPTPPALATERVPAKPATSTDQVTGLTGEKPSPPASSASATERVPVAPAIRRDQVLELTDDWITPVTGPESSAVSGGPGPGTARWTEQRQEARTRLEQLESEWGEPSTFFDRLGIELNTPPIEIHQAFDRQMERISLEGLAPDLAAELSPFQRELQSKLVEALDTLSDPKEREAYEQQLFEKELPRAADLNSRRRLAEKLYTRGQWYLTANRPELARRWFQRALELNPQEPLYYAYVGWACYRDGGGRSLMEAQDYLHHALQIHSTHDQAHYFLGVIAKREGDEKLALHHFHKALETNPSHAQAHRELALMQKHSKHAGAANQDRKKSLFRR